MTFEKLPGICFDTLIDISTYLFLRVALLIIIVQALQDYAFYKPNPGLMHPVN